MEDVAVDQNGNIYTAVGLESSSIYRIRPDNLTKLELIAKNEGQVLGICLSPDEKKLALADQKNGLKLLDLESGVITTLVSEFNGRKFIAVNSITFASNTLIYFTYAGDVKMKEFHL